MHFKRAKLQEFIDLRSAILVAVVVAGFLLLMFLLHTARIVIQPGQGYNAIEILTYGLVIWVLTSILIAYRRWYKVSISDSELTQILSGLNPDVFLVINQNRHIVMCNQKVSEMFGYEDHELMGQTTDLLYFDRRSSNSIGPEIHDHLEKVGFHLGYATGKKRDGQTFPLEIITGTLRGRRGAVLMIRDITRLIEAKEAHREKVALLLKLEENYEKLMQTESSRDTLTQMIVHDMKTPLQVIMGNMELCMMDLADREGRDSEEAEYLEEAFEHTKRLVNMVNSILDISRLETGDLPLNKGRFDLRMTVKRALASLDVLLQNREVNVDTPPDPLNLYYDPDVMQRVIVNLISNAIKHTPEAAEIGVVLRREGKNIRVEVRDTGPGIPESYKEKIFEKFGQIKNVRQIGDGTSTGIGLTFCKLAVEAHEGEIGVDSEEGKGSIFWFVLPIDVPVAEDQPDPKIPVPAVG